MTTAHAVHHINFIVKDLDLAVKRYQQAFGIRDVIRAELPQRGVRTARFCLGDLWMVLVQPTREDSVPGRHLRAHGEGVFLVSMAVENLDQAIAGVVDAGARVLDAQARSGLEGWKIQDLEPDDFFGVRFQFTEVAPPPEAQSGKGES